MLIILAVVRVEDTTSPYFSPSLPSHLLPSSVDGLGSSFHREFLKQHKKNLKLELKCAKLVIGICIHLEESKVDFMECIYESSYRRLC